jgi:hypothetical protein
MYEQRAYKGRRQTDVSEAKRTTVKLSPEGRRLLVSLAARMGLTMTGVLEVIIREMAKKEGIR